MMDKLKKIGCGVLFLATGSLAVLMSVYLCLELYLHITDVITKIG